MHLTGRKWTNKIYTLIKHIILRYWNEDIFIQDARCLQNALPAINSVQSKILITISANSYEKVNGG